MNPLFEQFTKDLKLSSSIIESLHVPRTNDELKVFALSIPDILEPDTYNLAGRIYIYLHTITSPRSVSNYVKVLERILSKETKKFLMENEGIFDELLEETYFYNFKNYTLLSASKVVDYLLRTSKQDPPVETPCQMMLRLAVQFYHEQSVERVIKCYREMINQEYVHASPTMFNAGTRKNQMSSCFLLHLGDNLEDLLYTGAGDVGMISKLQGGIGMSMNGIRHSAISNTGKSSGVLPPGRIYDDTIRYVDQGGKRNGAATLSLKDWHIDAEEFVQARDNFTQNGIRFKQANTALFVSRLFMERVRKDEKWTLMCPAKAELDGEKLINLNGDRFEKLYHRLEQEVVSREKDFKDIDKQVHQVELIVNSGRATEEDIMKLHDLNTKRSLIRKNLIDYRVVDARKFYHLICNMQVKSSFPYVVFADPVNVKNNTMNIGTTQSSNLCLEITLPATPTTIASCNLGHLPLKTFLQKDGDGNPSYDFNRLGRATQSLVENIDKVIDYNYYPLDKRDKEGNVTEMGKIHKPNIENRPLGIGVSGLGNVYEEFGYAYDSPESEILNKKIFSCIYYNALYKSHLLAKELGEYQTFRKGKSRIFKDGEFVEMDGSPLSNGYFQFDMWKADADYLEKEGRLNKEIYHREDDEPIDPSEWGNDLPVKNWDELKNMIIEDGVRNSMLLAPMPTASSSQMVDSMETTECNQTLLYSRKLSHGNYTCFSRKFIDDMIGLKILNKKTIDFINSENGSIQNIHFFVTDNQKFFPDLPWSPDGKLSSEYLKKIMRLRKIYKGMFEISPVCTARQARQRGIYVDQSQSLNVYIGEPNENMLKAYHMMCDQFGLKTGMYYCRANPASQTGRFTVSLDVKKYKSTLSERKKKFVCSETECIMCQ